MKTDIRNFVVNLDAASTPSAAATFDQAICTSRPRAEFSVLSSLLAAAPSVATSKSIDCLLAKASVLDALVWNALDAWRFAGLPKTQAINNLQSATTDSRVQHRLMTHQQLTDFKRTARPDNALIASGIVQ